VFLSNFNENNDYTVSIFNREFNLPHWSVSIYLRGPDGGLRLKYLSSSPTPFVNTLSNIQDPEMTVKIAGDSIEYLKEPLGIYDESSSIPHSTPLELFKTTQDVSDYLWYVQRNLTLPEGSDVSLEFENVLDTVHVFIDGVWKGVIDSEPVAGYAQQFSTTHNSSTQYLKKQVLTFRSPSSQTAQLHTLSLLVSSTGFENYGAYLEKRGKGILGKVFLNQEDITNAKTLWHHQVGLQGESRRVC
jgi:hypothetical protein